MQRGIHLVYWQQSIVSKVHTCQCANCLQEAKHPDKELHHQVNLLLSGLDEQQLREKFTVATAIDFPTASEILVSFPDKWELVGVLKREEQPLYVGSFPPSREKGRADQFYGLPAAINRSLTTYRLYRLFEPWPQPTILVDWDEVKGEGRVVGSGHLRIQLQPVGQAQAWSGLQVGVLWECFLHEMRRSETWQ